MAYKVRAWLPKYKTMVYSDKYDSDWIHLHFVIGYDGIDIYENRFIVKSKVMSWTGLKDKNEVDIYENDIVINTYFPKQPGVVRFSRGAFRIKDFIVADYHSSTLEVVGNTLETPELLEEVE